jgi:hypothetical protein
MPANVRCSPIPNLPAPSLDALLFYHVERLAQSFPRLFKEFAKPGMSFEMLRQEIDGDTAYIVWKAETADNRFELGTDTFIVKDGRIVAQTFAGKISPKH